MNPIEALKAGKVILYPTDTVYVLGVDATNAEAIRRLKEIKGRTQNELKPISITVADMAMAAEYADVTQLASRLAFKFLPGKLTLVLSCKKSLPYELNGNIGTVGVRIPNHKTCLKLVNDFGKPITSTSANLAGMPTHNNVRDILAQLGDGAVDVVIDEGLLPPPVPSTIVDARSNTPVIIRESALTRDEIMEVVSHLNVETEI